MTAVAASTQCQPSIDIATDELTIKGRAAIKLALRTCYWLACEELPNTKFRSLFGFLRAREVSASYGKLMIAPHDMLTNVCIVMCITLVTNQY